MTAKVRLVVLIPYDTEQQIRASLDTNNEETIQRFMRKAVREELVRRGVKVLPPPTTADSSEGAYGYTGPNTPLPINPPPGVWPEPTPPSHDFGSLPARPIRDRADLDDGIPGFLKRDRQ